MAFTDPLVVSIGGSNKNLSRINSGDGQSDYRYTDATQLITALIRNTTTKPQSDGRSKERHTISLRQVVFATSTTPELTRQASMTIEHFVGDDVTAYDDLALAVGTLASAANIAKLANFES